MTRLDIIYEDNHLLVVNKPAGIATMGAESGETVHSLAADYIKQKYNKPGNVYVGVVSRLDAMTSGVLVLARTSKAASRLVPQFGTGSQGKKKAVSRAVKLYLASVEGQLESDQGKLSDHVRKDDAAHRMRTVTEEDTGTQLAELEYVTLAKQDDSTIVALRLLSGRKHQIRLQFADRGHPVIGDRKYGSHRSFPAGVALHSWCLQITHPTLRSICSWRADVPPSWKSLAKVMPSQPEITAMVDEHFGLHLTDAESSPATDDSEETT